MGKHIAKQDPESLKLRRVRDAMVEALPGKVHRVEIGGVDKNALEELNERIEKACKSYINVFYDSMGDLKTRHEAGKRASLKRYLEPYRHSSDRRYLERHHYAAARRYLIAVFDEVFNDAKDA